LLVLDRAEFLAAIGAYARTRHEIETVAHERLNFADTPDSARRTALRSGEPNTARPGRWGRRTLAVRRPRGRRRRRPLIGISARQLRQTPILIPLSVRVVARSLLR
jgi:hypothetical protein